MPLTLTRSESDKFVAGNVRMEVLQVAFDATYPTGGETGLTPAALGMDRILYLVAESDDGLVFEYAYATNALIAYRSAGFTVTSHGTHPHNITTVAAAGGGSAMTTPMVAGALEGGAQTNTAAVDASAALTHTAVAATALVEVANGTDLSAVTGVRVFVIGR